jgi:hypothetical protein
MNYEIIKDDVKLREFIEWLPELQQAEKYYLCLFARSKYTKDAEGNNGLPHIKSDKAQLKRLVSDKVRMYDKIRQLQCEVGAYTQNDTPVPQEALALYITVNPRNLWKATHNSLVKLATCIRDNNTFNNPHAEVMSEIQRTKSRTEYVVFDIDYKGETSSYKDFLAEWVSDRVGNHTCFKIIETRGGYHVLVKPDAVHPDYEKTWYQAIAKNQYIDQKGDMMIPVVGCTQGNFIPHFINI